MHHQSTASHLSFPIADCLNRGHLLLAAYLTFLLALQHSFVPLLSCHPLYTLTIPPLQTSANSPLWIPYYYHYYYLPATTRAISTAKLPASCNSPLGNLHRTE